uniref:Uncharacterized protein n=1 Tax=Panthera tigris altaica TaxID=74533 RepID=A0A8C9JDL6_PANTA
PSSPGGLLGRGKAEGRPGKAGRGSRGPDDTSLSPTCSIHNGVIAVFQRKGLPDQELFSLNEGVRQLLKTELGSFFTEYLQLRTSGAGILREEKLCAA